MVYQYSDLIKMNINEELFGHIQLFELFGSKSDEQ